MKLYRSLNKNITSILRCVHIITESGENLRLPSGLTNIGYSSKGYDNLMNPMNSF